MAAIIDIYTGSRISSPPVNPETTVRSGAALRVIPGGLSPEVIRMRRIYLFRRCLVALVLLAVIVGAVMVARGLVASSGSTTSSLGENAEPYMVHRGDTLWGVARSIAPDSDPRDVIDEIAAVNSADGVAFDVNVPLTPGQQLLVPAGS
ncbi:MAG: LysM peptidoglycan-binding domain-containing protein [Microthrixaceae bacterium]